MQISFYIFDILKGNYSDLEKLIDFFNYVIRCIVIMMYNSKILKKLTGWSPQEVY